MAGTAWLVILSFSLCALLEPAPVGVEKCSGPDVERAVNVLNSVDFQQLAGWLDMGDEARDIEQYCDHQPRTSAGCCRRELLVRHCNSKGRGLHQTILDFAYALEHHMKLKRQANDLRKIATPQATATTQSHDANRSSVWPAILLTFTVGAASISLLLKSKRMVWVSLIILTGLIAVVLWQSQEDRVVIPTPSSSSVLLSTTSTCHLPTPSPVTYYTPSVPSPTTKPSPAVSEYAKFLKKRYAKYLSSLPDKLPFTLGKEYVRLTVVRNEIKTQAEADKFIHQKYMGDVDQILAEKEEIEMKDIFKVGESIRLVVVEGEPGIGKSTLALELCHQWQNETLLQQFSLVLLLRLREEYVRSATDIRDLFFHHDDDLRNDVAKEVVRNDGEGVLFILDGFDELPVELRKSSLVMNITNDPQHLPEATILVTSRPSASARLQRPLKSTISKHIEVVGFTRDSIHEAAQKALNDPDLFSKFSTYLLANPVLELIMHNPLNCAIVVNTYQQTVEEERPIPHTQTQLYTELSRCLISSYLSRKGDLRAKKLPEMLENLPKELYLKLKDVCKSAYDGVSTKREIFDELPGNSTGLGLLIEHRSLFSVNETIKYSFFHQSLQEYLSAFYVSQLEGDDQREFVAKNINSSEMVDVMKFVAGLTKMKKAGWDMFSESYSLIQINCSGSEGKCLGIKPLVIKCFYEAHSSENCIVFEQGIYIVEYVYHLDAYEMYALGFTISLCGKSWKLFLPDTTVSELEMLTHGLKYNEHSNGSIHTLDLTYSYEIMNHGGHLLQMPHHILMKIEVLILENCDINQRGFENLAMSMEKLHYLRVLFIHDNPGGSGSLVSLMQSLETHKTLEYLSMYDVNIGMEDITALSALLKSSSSLMWLMVGGWPASTPEIDTALVKTVLSPSSLVSVDINFMSNSHENFCILESIEVISNRVEYLTLRDVSSPRLRRRNCSTGKFREIIRENTSLKQLRLLFNFNHYELENILLSLEENNSLETLLMMEDMREFVTSQKTVDARIDFTMDIFKNVYHDLFNFTTPYI